MKLTDLRVRKVASKEKRFEISDGAGLALRVMPTGAKSWIYRYRLGGVARRMTLGTYPGISLALARERHKAHAAELQRGEDPAVKRDEAPTFGTAWDEFFQVELSKTHAGAARARMVEKDVLPYWKDRKLATITRRDGVLLLDRVRKRAKVTGNRVQSLLVRMMNFSAERGLIEANPLAGIKKAKEQPRKRVLAVDEIKALWASLDLGNEAFGVSAASRLVLKMILLTGQRPGEVAGMEWAEIDEKAMVWTIPAARMKSKLDHKVPLCSMALSVLEQARFTLGGSEFVFQSEKKPGALITRQGAARAARVHWKDMGAVEAFTPHDLRRTMRTMLAELGVDDVIAEKVLGHSLAGMLKIYNQHPYDAEKRQALTQWETRLTEIVGGLLLTALWLGAFFLFFAVLTKMACSLCPFTFCPIGQAGKAFWGSMNRT